MRVIAGEARGRNLKSPDKKLNVRPTISQIKEAIFNIIMPDIKDSVFLDLFSGSGSIGIEALSRGSKKVFFVEKNLACVKIIKKNLELTRLDLLNNKSKVILGDARNVIKDLYKNNILFDIIFMDPPYYKNLAQESLMLLSEYNLLNKNGFIICETGSKEILPDIESFDLFKSRYYTNTHINFLARK